MGLLDTLRGYVMPVCRAEQLQEADEAPPSPSMSFEAPEPAKKSAPASAKGLESLSAEELEQLKQEVVNEVVTKIAGDENEKLEDFLEPEVG
jgi:cytochrome c oxidase subunit 6b